MYCLYQIAQSQTACVKCASFRVVHKFEGDWDLFYTATANTDATPGLAPLTWAIDEFTLFEGERERQNMIQNC